MADTTPPQSTSYLHRSDTNRIIGGVCGGLGEYFNIDPTIFRLLFVILAIFGGSGFLIYLILWIVMPGYRHVGTSNPDSLRQNADEISSTAQDYARRFSLQDSRRWWGILVLVVGAIFLLNNFGISYDLHLGQLWPLLLVLLGIVVLTRR